MKPLVTEINAKLRNIIVLDSDKMAVYKKVRFWDFLVIFISCAFVFASRIKS